MSLFSLFSQGLVKENFVFFDVETTGLYPLAGERVVEIAMLKVSGGEIIDKLEIMLNPEISMPPEVTAINHITDDMLKDCPVFTKELAEKILKFIDNYILVAHNAAFDLGFLSTEFGRQEILFDKWNAIDTLKIAVHLFPGQKNRLESLMKRYNITQVGDLHRALNDTIILQKVFFEMLDETDIRNKTTENLINKFGFKGNFEQFPIPKVIKDSLSEKKVISAKYKKRDGKSTNLDIIPLSFAWVEKKWFLIAKDMKSSNILSLYTDSFLEFYS
ncbi:MAG: hypothetical protein A2086_01910 [Spirochaetes bacterium GWD1_27_9]|nr:MAG: hypothetical protein A2Y34_10505 [Spirochaetes bacterium GWC1_27_15]OHD41616.1 MAG: hypothetical protein A2086_01910 [Spirochaetes bacterium GWD1_27_9]